MKPAAAVRPGWVDDLVAAATDAQAHELSRFLPPAGHLRRSAVLILFGSVPEPAETDHPGLAGRSGGSVTGGGAVASHGVPFLDGVPSADVLLTERARTLRAHAGQVAFPGGRIDGDDAGPAAAALREAQEETGLDPAGVEVLAELPELYLPVSDFAVIPVLAWWRRPSPVSAVDPQEVAHVVRVAVPELVDPRNRFRAVHPSGFVGPAFEASGLFVWGFTAGLLDRLLALAGWERPWDTRRLRDVPVPPATPQDMRTES